MLIYTGMSAVTVAYLAKHDPALLERRMKGGPVAEKRPLQKLIMLFIAAGFIALLVVPALDFRFGWSAAPATVAAAGNALAAAGFGLIFRVYRENTFSSAAIEVAENQKVIATGPYAVVRHPMYAGALLYLAGTPLALGSYWGLAAFGATLPFLIWRLLDEERFLDGNLPGYTDYRRQVRYRLLPSVW